MEAGVSATSTLHGWLSVYINYLEFFYIGDFYSTPFIKNPMQLLIFTNMDTYG